MPHMPLSHHIRHSLPRDLPALTRLAKACQARAPWCREESLARLLAKNPEHQLILLIDGRIAGAAYTRPIALPPFSGPGQQARTGQKNGSTGGVQLLGFHLIPSLVSLGYGDLLLEWALVDCGLRPGISRAVALVDLPGRGPGRTAPWPANGWEFMPFGPGLFTCLNHGAHILPPGLSSLNRSDTKGSLMVAYDLPYSPGQGHQPLTRDAVPDDRQRSLDRENPEKEIRAAITLVLESRNRPGLFDPQTAFYDMGMDALDLAGLRMLLSSRLNTPLAPTFFYKYSSPKAVTDFFTQSRSRTLNAGPASPPAGSGIPMDLPQGPVAVVGMACRFPGAPDLEQFWQLLSQGRNAVTQLPPERWQQMGGKALNGDRDIFLPKGGFLDDIADFDAGFFNISPREARQLDPQQRLLLEINRDALEFAGIAPHGMKDLRAGCYTGIFTNDYQSLLMRHHQWADYDLYYATGTSQATAAGRLAYVLGCTGPALSINTACSSGLVAVHTACRSLAGNECDLALASGVNLILSPEMGLSFSRGGMISPDGICQTFDAKANGYVRSEGAGALVLMRLEDALSGGYTVYAVIQGSAVNQDGASNGLTAPNGSAQAGLIQEALDRARLGAADIDYLEAHGTGTPLGDAIEYEAIHQVFSKNRPQDRPLVMGSVKTNIGHTESAAGMAGLIKVILAMARGTIPAHLHFNTPGPLIDLGAIPAQIPVSALPWPKTGRPRCAGVSSFGFSGTNAHVILQQAPAQNSPTQDDRLPGPGTNILTLSAATPKALDDLAAAYAEFLDKPHGPGLGPICYTSQVGRTHFTSRLALVGRDSRDLAGKLALARTGRSGSGIFRGRGTSPCLAYLFTGQGAQYPGMAKELYRTDPGFRQTLDRCHDLLAPLLDLPLLDLLFDPGHRADLNQTIHTQPALFALEYALARRFTAFGAIPEFVMGHSVGEYTAACLAGIFSLEDGLRLISARAALMQALPRTGAMAAVLAPAREVKTALGQSGQGLEIAAYNGPANTVVSGPKAALATFVEALSRKSVPVVPLKVSHAFHSSKMTPMLERFEAIARTIAYSRPCIKILSNCRPGVSPPDMATPAYWVDHIRKPVAFSQSIQTLVDNKADIFLEIGPKPILTRMARACVPANGHQVFIPTLNPAQPDPEAVDHALAALYGAGLDIDWPTVRAHTPNQRVALPTYPYQRTRFWLAPEQLPRESAREGEAPPLLGTLWDANQGRQIYTARIGTRTTAFLSRYRMGTLQALPGAAFAALALEAAQALWPGSPVCLTGLVITRPLVMPPPDGCRIQTFLSRLGPDTCDCSIFTMAGEADPAPLQEHCRVTLARSGPAPADAGLTGPDLRAFKTAMAADSGPVVSGGFPPEMSGLAGFTCDPPADHNRIGQNRIDQNHTGQNRIERKRTGLARVCLPDLFRADHHFFCHPILLDACFKTGLNTLAAAVIAGQARDRVLMAIDRFELYGPPPRTLWCRADCSPPFGDREAAADLKIYGPTGEAIARVRGMLFCRPAPGGQAQKTGPPARIYTLSWQPAPLPGSRTGPAMPDPESIRAAVNAATPLEAGTWQAGPIHGDQKAGLARLESLSRSYAAAALADLGWDLSSGVPTPDQMNHLGIHPNHRRLMNRLITILKNQTCDSPHRHDPGNGNAWPMAELSLLKRCGPYLAKVLQGDLDPVSLLFPDGDLGLTTALYETAPAFAPVNQAVGTCVSQIIKSLPTGSPLRILEIGAGTGGTTSHVLSGINAHPVRYTFTDVTPMFLRKAKKRFADRTFIDYRLLDIETHPLDQGYASGAYDLIIAANVLHATPDLDTTLGHIRHLTAPGGILVLVEGTAPRAWIDLIFGLTRGWWKFIDHHRRPGYPLIDAAQWQDLLREKGFTDTAAITPVPPESALFPQSVLMGRLKENRPVLSLGTRSPKWLIIGSENSQARALARALGHQHCTIIRDGAGGEDRSKLSGLRAPGSGSSGQAALLGLHIPEYTRVIFLPEPVDGLTDPMPPAQLGVYMAQNCGTLLALVHALAADPAPKFEGLWILTSGTGPGSQIHPFHAPIWAMADTIRYEHPELNCRSIDIGQAPDGICLAADLIQDRTAPPRAALDRGTLLVPCLGQARLRPGQTVLPPSPGPVLITGGLGGLGMETAGYLIQKGYQRLVLLGRKPPSPDAQKQIRAFEAGGARIRVMAGDVSDPKTMAAVFERLDRSGRPVSGIIHAAGVFEDHLLVNHNWASFERVFAAKVQGSWILHTLTQKRDLDFFVLFSSAMTVLPHPGLGNYAAANSFMDSLARYRRHLGLPGLSIAWGPYGDKGMAGALSGDEKARWAALGLAPMDGTEALERLDQLMSPDTGIAHAAVMAMDRSVLAGSQKDGAMYPGLADGQGPKPAGAERPGPKEDLASRLKEQPAQARQILGAWLKSQVAQILGFENPDEVDGSKGFFKQGMDSLTALELRSRLQSALETRLPATLLFRYPTIRALSRYLSSHKIQDQPPPRPREKEVPAHQPPDPQAPDPRNPEGSGHSDTPALDRPLSTAIDEEISELEKMLSADSWEN